jgi:cbb3-type cytochrome oxidase maturation protein
MSFLALTIPIGLLLGAALLALVLRAVNDGAFDDLEGAAQRHLLDDDREPERTER